MTMTGLCIGGPLDGQRLVHDKNHYEVWERPPVQLAEEVVEPSEFSATKIMYVLHAVNDSFGLWLLFGQTLEDASRDMAATIGLPALAQRYEQIVARRKDDERRGR